MHGWKEEPRDPTRDRGNVNSKFRVYHYRRKNDIILTLFDGEIMSLDESEGNFMATSSITANFYTDDPKAANKIVHALFSGVKSSSKLPTAANSERKYTPVQERAFWRRFEKFMDCET